ncbi:MAG TPA: HAD hydrolase family protein [Geobacteraceae bacterium]|nr:HAD hydrolase family protein [Geobacteraceae bacterium]
MIEIDIPGFGFVRLEHLVSDFTGTLSVDGALLPGVKVPLNKVAKVVKLHVLTADTFGTAQAACAGVDCALTVLSGEVVDIQKERYVRDLGAESVIAIGNGNNDRKMLAAARIGIAVMEGEGCSLNSILSADIVVRSINDGLGLLLEPRKLKATLRI